MKKLVFCLAFLLVSCTASRLELKNSFVTGRPPLSGSFYSGEIHLNRLTSVALVSPSSEMDRKFKNPTGTIPEYYLYEHVLRNDGKKKLYVRMPSFSGTKSGKTQTISIQPGQYRILKFVSPAPPEQIYPFIWAGSLSRKKWLLFGPRSIQGVGGMQTLWMPKQGVNNRFIVLDKWKESK